MSFDIETTDIFEKWVRGLRDQQAVASIFNCLRRIRSGNLGSHRSIGAGVSEFKINTGPGYRLYYTLKGQTIVLLLCGGDKGSQRRDIERAKAMVRQMETR